MKKFSKSILSLIVCLVVGLTCSISVWAEDTAETNIKVAFAGDSICNMYTPYFNFPGTTIDNYGVGGYTTEEVLDVVQNEIKGDYDKLILICGVNDCTNDDWLDETFVDSMANFRGMFETAKQNLPNAKVYVTGIFPTLGRQKHLVPTSIKYNAALKQLTEEYDNVQFIGDECWPALFDTETGLGKADYYKKDGLHLIEPGYAVLSEILNPYIYETNGKELDGKVLYQTTKNKSTMRFVAEMNIEDVQNATFGDYEISNVSESILKEEITTAYKSIKVNGVKKTAPEGKCYVITNSLKGCRAGDKFTASFKLDGFNYITREVTL